MVFDLSSAALKGFFDVKELEEDAPENGNILLAADHVETSETPHTCTGKGLEVDDDEGCTHLLLTRRLEPNRLSFHCWTFSCILHPTPALSKIKGRRALRSAFATSYSSSRLFNEAREVLERLRRSRFDVALKNEIWAVREMLKVN